MRKQAGKPSKHDKRIISLLSSSMTYPLNKKCFNENSVETVHVFAISTTISCAGSYAPPMRAPVILTVARNEISKMHVEFEP